MNWEQLNSVEFAKAVKELGVCIVNFGVVERHGDHLPLGTDYLIGHKKASLAAKIEPAIVFPPFYFGQIYEAKCFPGTITINPVLLIQLIQDVFDDIARNGIKKIIVYNSHGGNNFLLKFMAQCQLSYKKDYQVYVFSPEQTNKLKEVRSKVLETKTLGHACEWETSEVLYLYPGLVKMENVPSGCTLPLGKLNHLPTNFTALSWYSNYPDHYVGDASYATSKKGEAIVNVEVELLAEFIKAVKNDEVLPQLNKEFHERY